MGFTFTSAFSYHRTKTHQHSSVVNIGNKRDVWRYLALMAISYPMIPPKFIADTLRSSISIGTGASIHLGVLSERRGAGQHFITSNVVVFIILW
ncbi:hypothetical protein H5410_002577 [Solanum commersonii]|uniref:Uncharacterized protein n=1 Tax=Solanum commersonii TaxID=4109 RepID=A0A9J6B2I7_SOLCO|nr:hypothetical protein H5410_002577 [Solanum commersonii]